MWELSREAIHKRVAGVASRGIVQVGLRGYWPGEEDQRSKRYTVRPRVKVVQIHSFR